MSDQQTDQAQDQQSNEQNVENQNSDQTKDQSRDDQQKASEKQSEDKSNFQSRIDQLTARAKAAEEEVKKFREEQEKKQEEEMMKKGEHESLLNKYKTDLELANSKLERVGELEEALKTHLDSQLSLIPEEKRGLIPESFTLEQQLKYISQNRPFLMDSADKQKQVNTGASVPKNDTTVNATKQDLQAKLDEYLKRKRDIGYLTEVEKSEVQKLVKEIKGMDQKSEA